MQWIQTMLLAHRQSISGLTAVVGALFLAAPLHARPEDDPFHYCETDPNIIATADVNCNGIARPDERDPQGNDCLDISEYPGGGIFGPCETNDDTPYSWPCDTYTDPTDDGLGATCNTLPFPTDPDMDCFGDSAGPIGICDNCPGLYNPAQEDSDNDGVGDLCDNCPTASNPSQRDTDNDGFGDSCDNCRDVPNPMQLDPDLDLVGSACDNCANHANIDQADNDADNAGDVCDNCPDLPNADQADSDTDNVGNVCDNCPDLANSDQADNDADSLGDLCDNCPDLANADQADKDADLVGDICDNCPAISNPDQSVSRLTTVDGEAIGRACEYSTEGGAGCSTSDTGTTPWLPFALFAIAGAAIAFSRRRQDPGGSIE